MPDFATLRCAVAADRDALIAVQTAAYEPNRAIIGGTPTPLTWDYDDALARWETWLALAGEAIVGALILEARPGELYIQSVAVAPEARGRGIGNQLLSFAETRAREQRLPLLRLIANARLTFNVDWYTRKGFAIERIEAIGERRRVHMIRTLAEQDSAPAIAPQAGRPLAHQQTTNIAPGVAPT